MPQEAGTSGGGASGGGGLRVFADRQLQPGDRSAFTCSSRYNARYFARRDDGLRKPAASRLVNTGWPLAEFAVRKASATTMFASRVRAGAVNAAQLQIDLTCVRAGLHFPVWGRAGHLRTRDGKRMQANEREHRRIAQTVATTAPESTRCCLARPRGLRQFTPVQPRRAVDEILTRRYAEPNRCSTLNLRGQAPLQRPRARLVQGDSSLSLGNGGEVWPR